MVFLPLTYLDCPSDIRWGTISLSRVTGILVKILNITLQREMGLNLPGCKRLTSFGKSIINVVFEDRRTLTSILDSSIPSLTSSCTVC